MGNYFNELCWKIIRAKVKNALSEGFIEFILNFCHNIAALL